MCIRDSIYGLDVKTTIDNTTFLILNIAFEHFFKPLPRHSHGNNSYELHYIPNAVSYTHLLSYTPL